MPGQGQLPKEKRSRERDNPKFDTIVNDGERFGPDLPEGMLPNGEEWHPMTREWWEAVRTYPLLRNEPAIGWQFLLDTALMHHVMWSKGKWEFAAELRLRAAKIATTPEDRLRMKIKVVPANPVNKDAEEKAGPKGVTSLDDRRSRLSS